MIIFAVNNKVFININSSTMKKNLILLASMVALLVSCSSNKNEKVVDIDGNEYTTIVIGNREWMVENLKTTRYNDGTPIQYCADDSAWIKAGETNEAAWCVYGEYGSAQEAVASTTFGTYGVIYNFFAVEKDKLAPEGWRVATNNDWVALENYLVAQGFNYDDTRSDNKIAKALTDNILWKQNTDDGLGDIGTKSSFVEKNNATGFSAVPGGDRRISGLYVFLNEQTFIWTSTVCGTDSTAAWARQLSNTEYALVTLPAKVQYGFSVRCVRDVK
jgi:uncharacterized protein (TIGR02145 family)